MMQSEPKNNTMPPPDTADEVMQRKTAMVGKAQSQLKFKKNKLREIEGKVVDNTGHKFRAGFANESAARREEVYAIEARVRELKQAEEEAAEDAPRRARLRERMSIISEDHVATEKQIEQKRREITALEQGLDRLRAQHDALKIREQNVPSELAKRGLFDVEPEPDL